MIPLGIWDNATVLLTGGTGSFGCAFTAHALRELPVRSLRVFSRDELKQAELQAAHPGERRLSCLVGDVRDRERLALALRGVNLVVHAAAMKRIESCQYNPGEALQTNSLGAYLLVQAAIAAGVSRVVALSTDKAVNPVNCYGASKLLAEHLFCAGNHYAGAAGTRFACTRWGNVLGSRGSVVPLWLAQRAAGQPLTVTDPAMTRFWITLPQAVRFVVETMAWLRGGEVWVPAMVRCSMGNLAAVVGNDSPTVRIPRRPGEKRHEVVIAPEEADRTWRQPGRGDCYQIEPEVAWWEPEGRRPRLEGALVAGGLREHGLRSDDPPPASPAVLKALLQEATC